MLNIATPALSPAEWQGVRQALGPLADCGCGDPPAPTSLRGRVGRVFHVLSGHDEQPALLSPEQRAIRDFLCASGRHGRIAEDHVPALNAYGFTRAQVEAMALVAA